MLAHLVFPSLTYLVTRVLPPRTGAHPIDHSLTLFNRVVLPNSALLGSLEKPHNEREHFFPQYTVSLLEPYFFLARPFQHSRLQFIMRPISVCDGWSQDTMESQKLS